MKFHRAINSEMLFQVWEYFQLFSWLVSSQDIYFHHRSLVRSKNNDFRNSFLHMSASIISIFMRRAVRGKRFNFSSANFAFNMHCNNEEKGKIQSDEQLWCSSEAFNCRVNDFCKLFKMLLKRFLCLFILSQVPQLLSVNTSQEENILLKCLISLSSIINHEIIKIPSCKNIQNVDPKCEDLVHVIDICILHNFIISAGN